MAGFKERQKFILEKLRSHGMVRPKDVTDNFYVTKDCGRLDMIRLRRDFPGLVEFRYIGQSGYWCLSVSIQQVAA